MKQVLEYFGSTIVAIMVAGCVMGLFSILPRGLGKIGDVPFRLSQVENISNQAFFEYQTTPKWEISLKENYDMQTGVVYDVADFFTATDPVGAEQKVRFSTGWYEGDPDVKMMITNDGKEFSFNYPGIYLVTLGSHSPISGYYEMQVRLLVNGEVAT